MKDENSGYDTIIANNDTISTSGFVKLHKAAGILHETSCYDDASKYCQHLFQILTGDIIFALIFLDYILTEINNLCRCI